MLGGDLLELLVLRNRLRAEHWLIDLTKERLALAHSLAELEERDGMAAQQVRHVVYHTERLLFEHQRSRGIRLCHQDFHDCLDGRKPNKDKRRYYHDVPDQNCPLKGTYGYELGFSL